MDPSPTRRRQSDEDTLLLLTLAESATAAIESLERRASAHRGSHPVLTDQLTGLPNRSAWNDGLIRELARARRADAMLSVAMIEIDRLDQFSAANGHRAGEELVRDAAFAWRDIVRPHDLLAHFGGYRFALAIAGIRSADFETLAERLDAAMPDGQRCSAGFAFWDGVEGPEDLIARAAEALSETKAARPEALTRAPSWPPARTIAS